MMIKAQLAPKIVIKWDPVKDDGQIRFDLREFVLDDQGKPTSYANINEEDIHFEDINKMAIRIADLTGFETDPVTNETLPSSISGAMIMRCIKQMTNTIITEKKLNILKKNLNIQHTQSFSSVKIDMNMNGFFEGDTLQNINVDWGDGNIDNVNSAPIEHTYDQANTEQTFDVNVVITTDMFDQIEYNINGVLISSLSPEEPEEPTEGP